MFLWLLCLAFLSTARAGRVPEPDPLPVPPSEVVRIVACDRAVALKELGLLQSTDTIVHLEPDRPVAIFLDTSGAPIWARYYLNLWGRAEVGTDGGEITRSGALETGKAGRGRMPLLLQRVDLTQPGCWIWSRDLDVLYLRHHDGSGVAWAGPGGTRTVLGFEPGELVEPDHPEAEPPRSPYPVVEMEVVRSPAIKVAPREGGRRNVLHRQSPVPVCPQENVHTQILADVDVGDGDTKMVAWCGSFAPTQVLGAIEAAWGTYTNVTRYGPVVAHSDGGSGFEYAYAYAADGGVLITRDGEVLREFQKGWEIPLWDERATGTAWSLLAPDIQLLAGAPDVDGIVRMDVPLLDRKENPYDLTQTLWKRMRPTISWAHPQWSAEQLRERTEVSRSSADEGSVAVSFSLVRERMELREFYVMPAPTPEEFDYWKIACKAGNRPGCALVAQWSAALGEPEETTTSRHEWACELERSHETCTRAAEWMLIVGRPGAAHHASLVARAQRSFHDIEPILRLRWCQSEACMDHVRRALSGRRLLVHDWTAYQASIDAHGPDGHHIGLLRVLSLRYNDPLITSALHVFETLAAAAPGPRCLDVLGRISGPPLPMPSPDTGELAPYCDARITVDAEGAPREIVREACPKKAEQRVRKALEDSRWRALQGPAEATYQFWIRVYG